MSLAAKSRVKERLMFAGLVVLTAFGDRGPYDPTDRLVRLPSYGRQELRNEVTGTVILQVNFIRGRVENANVSKTELFAKDRYLERYPGLIDLWLRRIESQIRELETNTTSSFEADIRLDFRQDGTLRENDRKYTVEYGAVGVPVRIEITGPVIQ